ncbi:MAG: hypothetical protein ACI4KH_02500 [Oscillospiraceae bacterium]
MKEMKLYLKPEPETEPEKTAKKRKKPKHEFSKVVIVLFVVASLVYTSISYILAFMGLETVEGLSAEIVRVMWGTDGLIFLCYAGQNGIRAWSKNKYLNKKDGENYGNETGTTGFSSTDYSVSDSRYEED